MASSSRSPTFAALLTAYDDLAARLGPRVVVQHQLPPGAELYLGIVSDPMVGPILLVGAGGTRVEALGDRRVALPPMSREMASVLLGDAMSERDGVAEAHRGQVIDAILGMSQIALELGDIIDALDINPLLVTPTGVAAVDALILSRAAPASDVPPA